MAEYDPETEEYSVSSEDGEVELEQPGNPLYAWAVWIGLLDGRMRRKIGDALEAQGKNRWTGEPKNDGGRVQGEGMAG